MTPSPALNKLHWPIPHPPFSRHAGLVGSVVLGVGPLAQSSIYECCILGAATVHHSLVASAEICNANEPARILHPLTCNTALLNGAHITLLPMSMLLHIYGTQGSTSLPLLCPSSSLCLLWCVVFASHSLYAAERTAGFGICCGSLEKCLSALNTLGREWEPDSHLHCGSMKQE